MRRELLLLDEIITASERAIAIVGGRTVANLQADPNARDALLWNLTVIGEATSQLPESLRGEHLDIPWRQPVRLRNRIVHGYWSIDLDIVHAVAAVDLAPFAEQVRAVRTELESEPHAEGGPASGADHP